MSNHPRTTFTWTRRQTAAGTILVADPTPGHQDDIVIRKTSWAKPGFKNITSSGWMVYVHGESISAAFPTMRDARRHAELPGVAQRIGQMLANTKRS